MMRQIILATIGIFLIGSLGLSSRGQDRLPVIEDVTWSPSGDYLIVQREWQSWIYDANDLVQAPARGAGFHKIVFGADDSRFVALTITGTGAALVYTQFESDRPIAGISNLPLRNKTIKDELENCLIQPPPVEIAFSPTGELFARIGTTAGGDGSIFIYANSSNVLSVLHSELCTATDIAFSPDGSQIASSHLNGAIQILNVTDGSLLTSFDSGFAQARALAFHPNGKSLAVLGQLNDSSETVIKVWDIESGEWVYQLTGLATSFLDVTEFLEDLLFSPDASMIATADEEGTIFIWDTVSHDLLERIENPALITGLSFSPDSQRVAYGGHEGLLYVKDLREDQAISELLIPTLSPTPTIDYPTLAPRDTLTPRPSHTPTATAVLTPSSLVCADAPPTRLNFGMLAMVSVSTEGETRINLRVRTEPGGEQVASMEEGTEFYITAEPVCFDDLMWWQIETLDGAIQGWSAEGFAPDDYFITPVLLR